MTETPKPLTCPSCGQALEGGKAHSIHDYKDMKLQLDGYLKPGEKLHRNMLFDTLYSSMPKESQAHVQFYNYEISPKGFTNWHIHMGATFYLTLQGQFEGHFQEGVLIEGKAGEVYSEPIGKPHRGHNHPRHRSDHQCRDPGLGPEGLTTAPPPAPGRRSRRPVRRSPSPCPPPDCATGTRPEGSAPPRTTATDPGRPGCR